MGTLTLLKLNKRLVLSLINCKVINMQDARTHCVRGQCARACVTSNCDNPGGHCACFYWTTCTMNRVEHCFENIYLIFINRQTYTGLN